MRAYRQERFENAIAHFAQLHRKRARFHPSLTAMLKYLAFFEFELLRETGQPPLGLTHQAMKWGPVAKELYRDRPTSAKFSIVPRASGKGEEVRPRGAVELVYFSEYEIEKMHNLAFIYAQQWIDARVMSDASHQKIKAWRRAFDRAENSTIDFSDEFVRIHEKSEDELTPEEDAFRVFEALTKGRA